MRLFVHSALLATAMLVSAPPVFAGVEGTMQTTVSAFAAVGTETANNDPNTDVSYSTPAVLSTPKTDAVAARETYIAYTVLISNSGKNTTNNIRFTGSLYFDDPALTASFSKDDVVGGANCNLISNPSDGSVPSTAVTISCMVGTGQLVAGAKFDPFVVFFKVPQATNAANPQATNAKFTGKTYYAETDSGGNPLNNSATAWTDVIVGVGKSIATDRVRSAVTTKGGSLFTGKGDGTDTFSTFVRVPAGAYTTVQITQAPLDPLVDANCNNFNKCFTTTVKVPGSFDPYLTFELHVDSTNIKPGTKIGSVLIRYTSDDGTSTSGINNKDVPPCNFVNSLPVPSPDFLPCIAYATAYKKGIKTLPPVAPWTQALDGDFVWTLINKKNGGYKVY